ncbi:hypothetical protein BDC45DRAFT_539125 [Circinella umbellata]|nr:hypothetical protein BDC45DRAFT_539125 [Circinella umbellata]
MQKPFQEANSFQNPLSLDMNNGSFTFDQLQSSLFLSDDMGLLSYMLYNQNVLHETIGVDPKDTVNELTAGTITSNTNEQTMDLYHPMDFPKELFEQMEITDGNCDTNFVADQTQQQPHFLSKQPIQYSETNVQSNQHQEVTPELSPFHSFSTPILHEADLRVPFSSEPPTSTMDGASTILGASVTSTDDHEEDATIANSDGQGENRSTTAHVDEKPPPHNKNQLITIFLTIIRHSTQCYIVYGVTIQYPASAPN